mgnify:CR=1 FL=1
MQETINNNSLLTREDKLKALKDISDMIENHEAKIGKSTSMTPLPTPSNIQSNIPRSETTGNLNINTENPFSSPPAPVRHEDVNPCPMDTTDSLEASPSSQNKRGKLLEKFKKFIK